MPLVLFNLFFLNTHFDGSSLRVFSLLFSLHLLGPCLSPS